jgi:hypothetical protein
MSKSLFFKLAAAAGLILAAPGASAFQISTIDPNDRGEYEPAPGLQAEPAYQDPAEPYDGQAAPPVQDEYIPVDSGSAEAYPAEPAPVAAAPAPAPQQQSASLRASEAVTVPADDVFTAAEGVFGKGAEGLADLIEDVLKDQGEPSAYITGKEASGAFVLGARYGSGTLHHKIEGDRPVYWTGPSLGFDFGADASKVFVLVYNLNDTEELFRRYPAGEGKAYVVGGLTAGYLRRGNVVLIPVRMGAGLRLGVNAGYMRFSEKNRWLPF